MRVIGIDPGTALTGFGVLEAGPDGSITAVEFGVIKTSSGHSDSERLLELYLKLNGILDLHHPGQGAVERLFFQKNVKTAMAVGQARGVVLLCLEQHGISPAEYTPNEIKSAVSGYGAAGKAQIQKMVQMLLRLEELPKPDDAADALAVGICHFHTAAFHRKIQEQS